MSQLGRDCASRRQTFIKEKVNEPMESNTLKKKKKKGGKEEEKIKQS